LDDEGFVVALDATATTPCIDLIIVELFTTSTEVLLGHVVAHGLIMVGSDTTSTGA
jgi:hypothetical protein